MSLHQDHDGEGPQTVAETVGGTVRYEGTHLSNWAVTMPDGRKWNCETDASVSGGNEGSELIDVVALT